MSVSMVKQTAHVQLHVALHWHGCFFFVFFNKSIIEGPDNQGSTVYIDWDTQTTKNVVPQYSVNIPIYM